MSNEFSEVVNNYDVNLKYRFNSPGKARSLELPWGRLSPFQPSEFSLLPSAFVK